MLCTRPMMGRFINVYFITVYIIKLSYSHLFEPISLRNRGSYFVKSTHGLRKIERSWLKRAAFWKQAINKVATSYYASKDAVAGIAAMLRFSSKFWFDAIATSDAIRTRFASAREKCTIWEKAYVPVCIGPKMVQLVVDALMFVYPKMHFVRNRCTVGN